MASERKGDLGSRLHLRKGDLGSRWHLRGKGTWVGQLRETPEDDDRRPYNSRRGDALGRYVSVE